MKGTGIIRRFDDLGRIVIPKEMRTALSLGEGDPAEISCNGNAVIISKHYDGCIFCGHPADREYAGKPICEKCRKEIARE